MEENKTDIEIKTLSCKSCGASLRYVQGANSIHCDYCGSDTLIPKSAKTGPIREVDFYDMVKNYQGNETIEQLTFICRKCSAVQVLHSEMPGKSCVCCNTPLVIESAVKRRLVKPSYTLPFDIDRKAAQEKFAGWAKLDRMKGGFLKKALQNAVLNKVYVPYWAFSCKTITDCHATDGEKYTEYRNGDERQATRWTNVPLGTFELAFDKNVFVTGSRSLPWGNAMLLEQWNAKSLEPYTDSSLHDAYCEGYQRDVLDVASEAKSAIEAQAEAEVKKKKEVDGKPVTGMHTVFENVTFTQVLLPVWIINYRYRGRTYRCSVNGRSGYAQGEKHENPWPTFWGAFFLLLVIFLLMGGWQFIKGLTHHSTISGAEFWGSFFLFIVVFVLIGSWILIKGWIDDLRYRRS